MATVDGDLADIISGAGSGARRAGRAGISISVQSMDIPCECPPPVPPAPPVIYVQTSGPKASAAAAALGAGIIRPFRRTEHQDWASDQGDREVMSCVGQLLGTSIGSLPWRVDFGAGLEQLRHKNKTGDFVAYAQKLVDEALKRWEPRAQVSEVSVDPDAAENTLGLIVTVKVGTLTKNLRL